MRERLFQKIDRRKQIDKRGVKVNLRVKFVPFPESFFFIPYVYLSSLHEIQSIK